MLKELGRKTDIFLPTDVHELTEHSAYLGGRDYKDRPNVIGKKKGVGGGRSLLFSFLEPRLFTCLCVPYLRNEALEKPVVDPYDRSAPTSQ